MNRLYHPHHESRFTPKVAFGITLILVGLVWTLHNLDLAPWALVRFWPVLLVLLGLSSLWRRGILESVGGHLLIFAGLVGFAGEFGHEDLFCRWWPLAILWLGILLTLRALLPRPGPTGRPVPLSAETDECSHDPHA
jgi:hypothetical protein